MRLRGTAASGVVAFALAVALFGTTTVSPLYPLYEKRLGLGGFGITAVFATYAATVLATLIGLGGLSDRVGRRPVLVAGSLFGVAGAIVLLVATRQWELYPARVLYGVSGGLYTSAATAYLLDLGSDAESSARTSAVATAAGLGGGPVVAGLLARFVAFPLRTVFVVDAALLIVSAALLWLVPETVGPRASSGRLLQLPRVPAAARGRYRIVGAAGFCGFVVFGVFATAVPAVLSEQGVGSPALVGVVSATAFLGSTAAPLFAPRVEDRPGLRLGQVLLAFGVVGAGLSFLWPSLGGLIASGLVAGAGEGFVFRCGLAVLTADLAPAERTGTSAAFFTALYAGITVPVVVIGALAAPFGFGPTSAVAAGIVLLLVGGSLLVGRAATTR